MNSLISCFQVIILIPFSWDPAPGSNGVLAQSSWNDNELAKKLAHDLVKGVYPWRWSAEANEAYRLELELEKRETIGYQSPTSCTTPKVVDFRQRNRKYFIESVKQNLALSNTTLFCTSTKFLTCQVGICKCQDPLNMFWNSGLGECSLIPSNCRGFDVIAKNRLLAFDVTQPDVEIWKYPQGRFCPEKTPFCADLGKPKTKNFLFDVPSANQVGKHTCLHCDLETIQVELRQKMRLQHGQACNLKYQAALLRPKESAKVFPTRLETLHLISNDTKIEFCQFEKLLTCIASNSLSNPTCQCLPGLLVNGSGACVESKLNSPCGLINLAAVNGSPASNSKPMVIPADWSTKVNINCLPAGGTNLRCVRLADSEAFNTCSCPEGLFGNNCDIKIGHHLQEILHNPYQMPYNPSDTPQIAAEILRRLSNNLTNFEKQLTIGLGQECDLDEELNVKHIWAFLMYLYALTPKSLKSERMSYWHYEQTSLLIANKTNNGKTYCALTPGDKFNARCRPKPGTSIKRETKGYCQKVDYPSSSKIESVISETNQLRVILPVSLTGDAVASACNEPAEKLLMQILQERLKGAYKTPTEIMEFYDKILDLKELLNPTPTLGNPIVSFPKSLCSTNQGVACVAGVCQCRNGFEWYPASKKCLVSYGSICERCQPGHVSVYIPCSPPHECMPQSECTKPMWVPDTGKLDDSRHFTKYCHYYEEESPVGRNAGGSPLENSAELIKPDQLYYGCAYSLVMLRVAIYSLVI